MVNVGDYVTIGGIEFMVFSIVKNSKGLGDDPVPVVTLVRAHEGGYDEYYSLPLAAVTSDAS